VPGGFRFIIKTLPDMYAKYLQDLNHAG